MLFLLLFVSVMMHIMMMLCVHSHDEFIIFSMCAVHNVESTLFEGEASPSRMSIGGDGRHVM